MLSSPSLTALRYLPHHPAHIQLLARRDPAVGRRLKGQRGHNGVKGYVGHASDTVRFQSP